jgi:pilus assembly protein CpaC
MAKQAFPHPARDPTPPMMWNRKGNFAYRTAVMGCLLWPALFMFLSAGNAAASHDYDVSMNAGETYVIKDLDPDFTALVIFFDNARPFTVQSSSVGSLVVLGVEKGSGKITVARHGAQVHYRVTVNAIFDAKHPLAPGITPASISDGDIFEDASASAATDSVATFGKSDGTLNPIALEDKPTATESVPVSGEAPVVKDFKISAEPGDAKLDPGVTAVALPPRNSAPPAADSDSNAGSHAAPLDRGSGPISAPPASGAGETRIDATPSGTEATSLPSPASHSHLTSDVKIENARRPPPSLPLVRGRDSGVARAISFAPVSRNLIPARLDHRPMETPAATEPDRQARARDLSASGVGTRGAAAPTPVGRSLGTDTATAAAVGRAPSATAPPAELLASKPPATSLPPPGLRPGMEGAAQTGSAAPGRNYASAVSVVPSQSVNLPPPLTPERFTSNPPAPDQSADGDSEGGGARPLPSETILLTRGMSRVYDFPSRIRRVSIADTNIADIQVINPHQLMLLGGQPGITTLEVWDRQGNVEERQIIIDRRGAQQVMLNVVVAEINRGRLENQGLNYSVALKRMGFSLVGLPGLVATPLSGNSLPPGGSLIPLLTSPNLTYGLAWQNSNVLTQTFFQFLEDHNLGRVLARPRLLANSGEQAKFLSGGEIPIIISQELNTSIVFKQFGTSVTFLPIVIGRHALQLTVKSEVSSPDFSQGVVENGFSVPAFVTRRAETAVRMSENQTLIIAGLILEQTTSNVTKVPFLGDIPFLGYAFRTSSYNHTHTELVMTVTPEIVQAIPVNGEVALPTERPPLSRQDIRTGTVNPPDVTRPRP